MTFTGKSLKSFRRTQRIKRYEAKATASSIFSNTVDADKETRKNDSMTTELKEKPWKTKKCLPYEQQIYGNILLDFCTGIRLKTLCIC